MIEQLTICLFLFEVFFVELKKDRQTDSPKPSCDTKCLSRSSNECTTTPAEAGSSLGVPARKRALSALTRSLSELHVINFIRTSHTRIVVCTFVGHVQEGATRRRVLMRKVHTWLQQSGELRYITHDTEHNYRYRAGSKRGAHRADEARDPRNSSNGVNKSRQNPSTRFPFAVCVHAGV
jgi:hypothetical protein